MASIYKRKQDKSKKRSCWYIGYSDEHGVRRTRKGFTDKGETTRLAAKIEYDVMLRKRGVIDAEKEAIAQQKNVPMRIHLRDFEKHLNRNKQNCNKYVKGLISRIKKIVQRARFEVLGDVSAEKTEQAIGQLRDESGFGAKTYNHYIQAMITFGNWLISCNRMHTNSFVGIERMNCEVDIRKKRRALSPEEFQSLVQSARESNKTVQGYDGETRSRIYILSYLTGLRRKELAQLAPSNFYLNEEEPYLIVDAACSKHRREDKLPIHPALAELLKGWLSELGPDVLLFPRLEKRQTWLMVKKDLERAGIPYVTREGSADFHACGRHTYITQLMRTGATLAETRELARHSDIRMTMQYTHIGFQDQARALARIGWECSGSESSVSTGQQSTSIVNNKGKEELEKTSKTGRKSLKKQHKTPIDTDVLEVGATGIEPALQ